MLHFNRRIKYHFINCFHMDMYFLSIQKTMILALLAVLLSACQPASTSGELWKFSGSSMGTSYQVTVRGVVPAASLMQMEQDIKKTIDTVDAQMSTYKPDSELSVINRNHSTVWQPVSAALLKVLTTAQQISRLSAGAFDITVAPLVNLWGFGPAPRPKTLPTQDQIAELLRSTGYRYLRLQAQPPAVAKRLPALQLDLSAIAKGFAVDQVADYLQNLGRKNFLVEIGGEVRGSGSKSQGKPWQVAIEMPVSGQRTINRVIALRNRALATSGDYRNYFEKNGVRYSHTINPTTGFPIRHALASVSVLATNTMLADGLATALMVMGPDQGYVLATNQGIAARFLIRQGKQFAVKTTAAWKQYLRSHSGS